MRWLIVTLGAALLIVAPNRSAEELRASILETRKIWDAAPHNAFTDLIRFKDRWLCAFREGKAHVSPDGAVRVLESADGKNWKSAALVKDARGDLRDPKLSVTPDEKLMLLAGVALPDGSAAKHRSLVWFSEDGREWGEATEIGEDNVWMWRATWHKGKCYGAGYSTAGGEFVRLYQSRDGKNFQVLVPELLSKKTHGKGYPNESSMVFLPDDQAYCIVRRDADTRTAQLGESKPPYKEWKWKDLGKNIGGPRMIRLPDGRMIVGGRLYDGGARTSLLSLDPEKGELQEIARLPSSGDSSYPGLVWHDGMLWMSYYSSHEGKSAIHLARIKLD